MHVKHQDLSDGKTLRMVKGSPFLTIQGEGPYAGWPAVFIRLHGGVGHEVWGYRGVAGA